MMATQLALSLKEKSAETLVGMTVDYPEGVVEAHDESGGWADFVRPRLVGDERIEMVSYVPLVA